MSHAFNVEPTSRSHAAVVESIARDTDTEIAIVRALYEEEAAALATHATITQFVSVIATKRVKRRLRRLRAQQH